MLQQQLIIQKNMAIQTFYKCTLGARALTAVELTGVTVCGHALSHLCVSFKLQACMQPCDLTHTSKPWRVPQHTLGAPSIPSGLQKLPFPTQSAIKGDILEEAIQTASNEFLTTSVASGKEKGSGEPGAGERDPCWMHYSDLWAHLWAGSERPPASDHRGVKCAWWGSLSAPHCGPNDVWNVLIKSCLFIRLTIGFMGWALSGSASYCPQGNPPDRVTPLTSRRQISTWRPSIHLNGPLSVVAACHAGWFIWKKTLGFQLQSVFLSGIYIYVRLCVNAMSPGYVYVELIK